MATRVVRETIGHLRELAQLTINTGTGNLMQKYGPMIFLFTYNYLFICFSHDNGDNCMCTVLYNAALGWGLVIKEQIIIVASSTIKH